MRRNERHVLHGFAYTTRLNRAQGNRDRSRPHRKADWIMNVTGQVDKLEFASSVAQRMRGMLFRDPDDVVRILVPCHDVHTFGMRYPLDIAFISKEGDVLEVHREVSRMHRLKNAHAAMVAERFAKDGEWLQAGDVIRLGVLGDEGRETKKER